MAKRTQADASEPQMGGIDWDSLHTLGRMDNIILSRGQVKTLTAEEVAEINTALQTALTSLEPVVDLFQAAKDRYAQNTYNRMPD